MNALEANKFHSVKGGKVNFVTLTKNNLNSFKLLNTLALPVEYSSKFYEKVLETEEKYTRMGKQCFSWRHTPHMH